jgi:CRISPR-associated protein Csx3
MTNLLPAVLVGGPPHAGKSVLSYSLAKALRQRRVEHYLYRACPDGEGDWFQEGREEIAKEIRLRVKGQWSPEYAALAARQIERRPLPWLVDAGGQPDPLDAPIFHACTHAILLTSTAEAHTFWKGLIDQHGLILLADLHSDLNGVSHLEADHSIICGTLAGLHRSHLATGEVIEALADRVASLFTSYDPEELRQLRLSQAPVETVLELDRYALDAPSTAEKYWLPEDLPGLVSGLPAQTPLGLYGRAPIWVYGAVAAATAPAPLALFDVRLGWLSVPELHLDPAAAAHSTHAASGLEWRLHRNGDRAVLEMNTLPGALELDYEQIGACPFPAIPPGQGLICSGRLPNWLWTGLALCYQHMPWLAFYQLQTDGAIVIATHHEQHRIGDRFAFIPGNRQG